ncbi:type IV toxin-antitoxin system AbiEi family antitoxin [Vibrio zhugei]|uniref:Type IV toxin-antitoxin system AbiEi family antitoxin n=1 Tax=Vibrio zhugei TaxID=2479546 RepID=A0ABV7C7I6_9VIBR|nr:type IV toxin-antitoxin system AbiEi family antitoxin [Vibrio zhugei]
MSIESELINFTESLPKSWQAEFSYEQNKNFDGTLTIWLGERRHQLLVDFKRVHRKESLRNVKAHMQIDGGYVLVTNALTDFLKDECENLGLNYIDESGNIRIVNEDLYILITKPYQSGLVKKHPVAMTEGIVKCVFALICEPILLKSTYEEISRKAGISVSMANKAIKFLIEKNYIQKDKLKRRFFDENSLMYDWLLSYYKHIGSKQVPIPFPPPLDWKAIELPNGAIWGGEAAAAELTDYLHPQTLFLYSKDRVHGYEFNKSNPKAPRLQVCRPFWGDELKITEKGRAILTIAELLATQDGRNREVAEMINDKYLHLKTLP